MFTINLTNDDVLIVLAPGGYDVDIKSYGFQELVMF